MEENLTENINENNNNNNNNTRIGNINNNNNNISKGFKRSVTNIPNKNNIDNIDNTENPQTIEKAKENYINSRKYRSICINDNNTNIHEELLYKPKNNYKRLMTKDGNLITTKAEKIISKLLHLKNKALNNNNTEDVSDLNW